MGGFTNLKNDFKNFIPIIGPAAPKTVSAELQLEIDTTYQYLMLRCLFEIAGNLDTIAVEMRKLSSCVHDSHFDVDSEAKC